MKTIEKHIKEVETWEDVCEGLIQAIRNEAFDACIEVIQAKIKKKANPKAVVWLAGMWEGIYAIEELKREKSEE